MLHDWQSPRRRGARESPKTRGMWRLNFHDQPSAVPGRGGDVIIDGPEAEKAGPVHGGDGGDRDVYLHEIPINRGSG